MGIKTRLIKVLMDRIGVKQFRKILNKESQLSESNKVLKSVKDSPVRFDIPLEMMKFPHDQIKLLNFRTMRIMPSNMKNISKSLTSVDQNPPIPKTEITDEIIKNFVEYAASLGISSVGYAKLPKKLIFRNKAVLHDNAIVLAMEMDKEKIEQAPSSDTAVMIMRTYDDLGKASIRLTDFLREHGFSAQAGHPLGGLVLYPALAELAGIGYHGKHGLIITPEHGPRVRLTAIYTNIENLPFVETNNHEWINSFCQKCGRCERKCPGIAFYDQPVLNKNGLMTHIKTEFCFPVFLEYYGCSICIKECPFSRVDYQKLKKQFTTKTLDQSII